jgi:hypothetical protein
METREHENSFLRFSALLCSEWRRWKKKRGPFAVI